MKFRLMNWNTRRKMKFLVKSYFLHLSKKVYDGKFTTVLFDQRDDLPFYINLLSIAINHLKYIMFELVLKFYAMPEQQKTLLIW